MLEWVHTNPHKPVSNDSTLCYINQPMMALASCKYPCLRFILCKEVVFQTCQFIWPAIIVQSASQLLSTTKWPCYLRTTRKQNEGFETCYHIMQIKRLIRSSATNSILRVSCGRIPLSVSHRKGHFQEKELSHKCSTLAFERLLVAAAATIYHRYYITHPILI